MTRRHGIYLASGVAAIGLIAELAWFALDPKGDTRQHLIDQSIRLLDNLRDRARF